MLLSVIPQFLTRIILLLTGLSGGNSANNRDWRMFSTDTNQPYSLLSHSRQQINNIATQILGPGLGTIAGSLAGNLFLPKEFNLAGGFNSPLSGMLMRSNGGTYASAFQRMIEGSVNYQLYKNDITDQKAVDRAFYLQYYSITDADWNKGDAATRDAYRKNKIEAALKKFLPGLPDIVQALFDPLNKQLIVRNAQAATGSTTRWALRAGIDDPNTLVLRGRAVTKSVYLMAIASNLAGTDALGGKYKDVNYGGFTGDAVSKLAAVIANSSNMFNGALQIQDATNRFQNKVKLLTQAMAPLRDIFGKDMNAMINALQDISGVSISQMTGGMVRSISNQARAMSMYSGLSMGTLGQLGANISKMVVANNGGNFALIAGRNSGFFAGGLLTPGQAPWGMTSLRYQANTQNAMADIQASAGSDFMSMAYGLWRLKNANGNIDEFIKNVRQNMGTGISSIEAARKVAGVSNNGLLMRGLQSRYYSLMRMSGRAGLFGFMDRFTLDILPTALGRAKTALNVDFTSTDVDAVGSVLKSLTPQQLSQLMSNPTQYQDTYIKGRNTAQTSRMKNVFNWMINSDKNTHLVLYGKRAADAAILQQYQQTQNLIMKTFLSIDMSPSSGWNTFFDTFVSQGLNQLIGSTGFMFGASGGNKGHQIASAIVQQIAGNVFGSSLNVKGSLTNVLTALKLNSGDISRTNLISLLMRYAYMGGGKNNAKFKLALTRVSQNKHTGTDTLIKLSRAKDVRFMRLSMALGDSDLTQTLAANLNTQAVKTARETLQKQMQDSIYLWDDYGNVKTDLSGNKKKADKTQQLLNRRQANRRFRETIRDVRALDYALSDKNDELLKDQVKRKKFISVMRELLQSGKQLTDELYTRRGVSKTLYLSFKQKAKDATDTKSDVMVKLNTILNLLMRFLRSQPWGNKK